MISILLTLLIPKIDFFVTLIFEVHTKKCPILIAVFLIYVCVKNKPNYSEFIKEMFERPTCNSNL